MSSEKKSQPILLCEPFLEGNEWLYLKECLDTKWVSSAGKFVSRFESKIAEYVGVGHAVAAVNGTAALHMALLVAGVEPGDEVVTSTLTFIAPANAIRHAGATPVFIDADPLTWQMDANLAAGFLSERCEKRGGRLYNRNTGRRIGALLPVHILGHPVDMDPLLELARDFELPVVEDACESFGASYKGRNVGAMGDIACFSFNGNKLITCGGGGMIVTGDGDWAARARHLSTQARSEPIEYIHDQVAYNYRLTNIQAALGCAQFEQLDHLIAAKRRIAEAYRRMCGQLPGLTYLPEAPWGVCVFWLSTVVVDPGAFGMDSRGLLACLAEKEIEARPMWQPIHRSAAHRGALFVDTGAADHLHSHGLFLPSSCGLTPKDQERVTAAISAAAG